MGMSTANYYLSQMNYANQDLYKIYRTAFRDQIKPFAFVDLDNLDANAAQVLQRGNPKNIRIGTKSIRCRPVIDRILNSSPRYQGLLTYSAAESIWLANLQYSDLVIAYPVTDPHILGLICDTNQQNNSPITCMIDSVEHVNLLAQIARKHKTTLPICLDIDMSISYPFLHFGVWRSPLRTQKDLKKILSALKKAPQLRLDGIMGYEAQIAGLGDAFEGQSTKNKIVHFLKNNAKPKIAERRAVAVKTIQDAGLTLRFVNAGGTGSLEWSAEENWVTEITVGSAFYAPHLFDNYSHFKHLAAAGFAIEIVRKPHKNIYTCLSGGYIASGGIGKEKQPLPYLPQGCRLQPTEGAGEVQTPIVYKGAKKLQLGDPIFLRHSKAGELCEHFNELLLLKNGKYCGKFLTYRGEGKAFG